MRKIRLSAAGLLWLLAPVLHAASLPEDIHSDYDSHLESLFVHFHSNPELSLQEVNTAARIARELRSAGFEVTEDVGGTGVVGMLENGAGPLLMLRGDMDGLPLAEDTGLPYASEARQMDPITGAEVPVMHACGHDVHITSLVGTARHMSAIRDQWKGTLMLVAQPAEERGLGAKAMRDDGIWERFGTPDYVLAFHVHSGGVAGNISVARGSHSAASDTLDIVIHGVGSHGASPQLGKDPVVLGSQIVLALQTLVSRELPPRSAGVITVGSFHSGIKHNIIPAEARLQLTVRSTNEEDRATLIDGIRRIAENMGRVAGLPEDRLPEVIASDLGTPATINDEETTQRLIGAWNQAFSGPRVSIYSPQSMTAEDFAHFTLNPGIKGVYWAIGGTSRDDMDAAKAGGAPVPGHHSPFFKIEPRPAVTAGVESSVLALLELFDQSGVK